MKKILLFLIFLFLFPTAIFALDSVNINTASLQQLDDITGVGPATAQKITDARPFSSVGDLLRIKGIGPKTLQKIENQGVACVNCTTEVSQTQNINASNQNIINTTTATTAPVITPAIVYPSGIFINEIMPNPQGPDETNEWIELYNSNNFEVDLSEWQLQDQQGTITTFKIPQNTKISADGYLVFKRPDTQIMLNNDSDGLILLTPDGKIEDSMSFISAPLNQSYNKTNSGWQWSINSTPGSANIVTAIEVPQKTSTSKTQLALSKTKNSVKNNVDEAGLADINKAISQNQDNNFLTSPWFLFFIAGAAAIILSAIILFIKFKLKKNVRT